MSRPILIRGARQLVTLHGPPPPRRGASLSDLGIITDGAVLIRDGFIEEVGTSRRVEALAESRHAEEINAAGRVVMPGFVDSNTQIVTGCYRSCDTSIEQSRAIIEQTPLRILESQGMRLLEDFVRCGTTTVEANSGLGGSERNELKILRAHVGLNRQTSMVVSSFTAAQWPASTLPADQAAHLCSATLPNIKAKRLAGIAGIQCDSRRFSREQIRQYLLAARQLGFDVKVHAKERVYPELIADAIVFGAVTIEHATSATPHDIRLLAGGVTVATLLPGPVFFTSEGVYPPARALIDGAAAVALATNYNPYTSPCYNMQMIVALACRKMNMTVAEAITAATVNGAYATRRSDIGSLERGKVADLIILSIPDHREIASNFGVNMVEMTMRRGRIVYRQAGVAWPATQ